MRSGRVAATAAVCVLGALALRAQEPSGVDERDRIAPAVMDRAGYVLGPGDQLLIWALQVEEMGNKSFSIDETGYLSLPLVGRLEAAGRTAPQLETELAKKLARYIVDPQVTVGIAEYRSQPISVVGAVATPGIQQLRGRKTLLEAIASAGGLRADAGPTARITRKKQWGALPVTGAISDATGQATVAEVNIKAVISSANSAENIELRPDDVVSIPPASMIFVIGEVARQGTFPAGDEHAITALQALSMAGGATKIAAMGDAKILRPIPGQIRRTAIAVDFKSILSGKTQDVPLAPNDILFIPDSRGKRFTSRMLDTLLSSGVSVASIGMLGR